MNGTLTLVTIDAADVGAVADFYGQFAGWDRRFVEDGWITMRTTDGWGICLQEATNHLPPRWPDPAFPQQIHLDLGVRDLDAATQRAVSLGAVHLGTADGWHTLADPAGHPFDLCLSADTADLSILAVTLDAPDAPRLAEFYARILGLSVTHESERGIL